MKNIAITMKSGEVITIAYTELEVNTDDLRVREAGKTNWITFNLELVKEAHFTFFLDTE